MSRVRKGTRDLKDGVVLIKTSGNGSLRSMRCGHCQQVVSPTPGKTGQPVYTCKCGRTFSSRSM